MDGVTLADLRSRRDALNEEIRAAEQRECEAWNTALDKCSSDLNDWLGENSIEVTTRERKNEWTFDIGNGALVVTFGCDGTQWGRGLRMTSGRTLTLEWSEVPEPARLLAVVAVLLNRSAS